MPLIHLVFKLMFVQQNNFFDLAHTDRLAGSQFCCPAGESQQDKEAQIHLHCVLRSEGLLGLVKV